jgi:choline dehydrogenase-like flavoprotein
MDAAQTYLKWAQEYYCDIYTGSEVKKIRINYTDEDDLENKRRLASLGKASSQDLGRRLKQEKQAARGLKYTLETRVSEKKYSEKPRGYKPEEFSLTVPAHAVIIAAGTIASSRLLLNSGINPNRRVGKKFTLHPTAFFHGVYPGLIIDAFDGINNSYECTHFAIENRDQDYYDPEHHGFFLEASFSQPWGTANILPFYGERHMRLMKYFRNLQGVQLNVTSDAYGEVTETEVRYDISELDNQKLVWGSKLVARLMLKTGAREIYTGLNQMLIRSKDDIDPAIDNVKGGKPRGYMSRQALLHTGHPFGGNIMGTDPENSVVDETCESHHYKGLYICDGSVFPTTIGVNCHLSISMVARKTADYILQKKVSKV